MTSAFGSLQAQVASLNAQLAQMVNSQKSVDPRGYERLAKAAEINSKAFRNAAASTGMFEVQQVRLNSATDEYVKKLKAQKASFREIIQKRRIAAAAYKEQLAMEQGMTVRRNPASNQHGREVFDVTYPRAYTKEMDNAANRLSWFNENLKSGATQMVNWGKNTQWAGRQLMVGFTMPLAAFGAAAGVMAYQVDKQLTRVQKVYDTTANANSTNMNDMIAVEKELAAVRTASMETAIMAAREYGQAGTDTLAVQAELAATGKQGAELQKATTEVMRISRLGEIDYQTTTEATIALQSIWRMSNEELTESFDYMNSVENATSLSTADFATAIPVAGSAVKAFGGDVKELGILLTAMKENGIGASEGANALKATMQRLGRPSKQIREEWAALTGTDITKLVDDSDGLVEVFTNINAATAGLDDDARRKAFAGLFGSYQVSKMMALTKGMGELEQGVGQVSAAYEISNQSAEEWASTAAREIKRYQESVSGQFDTALQEVKLQLATLGEPFVEAATTVLKVVSKMIDGFNNLPDIAKKFIAWSAVIAGLAGPVVMLTGLFGNLMGQGLKGIAGMLSVVSGLGQGMKILDKENRIAAAAAKMMEAGYISQTKAVQSLTASLAPLAAAQRAANTASVTAAAGATAMNPAITRYSPAMKRQMDAESREAYMQRAKDTLLMQGTNKVYHGNDAGMQMSKVDVNKHAMGLLQAEAIAMNKEMDKANATTGKIAKNSKAIGNALAYGAAGSAAMAAGMLLTMTNSNETANNIGQFLILGSLVVPAAGTLLTLMSKISVSAAATAISTKATAIQTSLAGKAASFNAIANSAAAAAAAKNGTSMVRTATATQKMGTAARLAAGAFAGMLGPIGWAAVAVGAIATGLYMIHKKEKEAWAERVAASEAMDNAAKGWAEQLGRVAGEYERIALASGGPEIKEKRFDEFRRLAGDEDTDIGKAAKEFGELDVEQQVEEAKALFVDLQVTAGMSAKEARDAMAAIFVSTGDSFTVAKEHADDLYLSVGNLETLDWGEHFANQQELFSNSLGEFRDNPDHREIFESEAKKLAVVFGAAFENAEYPKQAKDILAGFTDSALSGFEEAFGKLSDLPSGSNFLEDNDITNAQELAHWYNTTANASTLIKSATYDTTGYWTATLGSAADVEKTIVKALAKTNMLGEEIDTVAELMAEANINAKTLTYSEAVNTATQLNDQLRERDSSEAGSSRESALHAMNAINVAQGYKQGKNEAQALKFLVNKVKEDTGDAAIKAAVFEGELSGAKNQAKMISAALRGMKAPDLANMFKGAYEATQQMIADDYTEAFDAEQDATMERTQSYWDRRVEGVSNDIERQSTALDNKWEGINEGLDKKWERRQNGAEKYWDARIEHVDKAIEAEEKAEKKRQEMFDAEIARIQRLNDMANRNIDFNIALNTGNLDEAAKIRNDANAVADEFAMQDVNDKLSSRSEKRVERLNNRKDELDKEREQAMKALEQREEAEKAAAKRREEAEKNHLEKVSEMRQKNAEAQRDAAVKAKEKELADQKKMLEASIEVFMSGTAAEKKEMKRRMEQAGLSYDWFEDKVIHPKGLEWGDYFGDKLHSELKKASADIASDSMWAQMGSGSVREMAKAMGFSSRESMFHFLETGEIKDFAEKPAGGAKGQSDPFTKGRNRNKEEIMHSGGKVGEGITNRTGVAKNTKGVHPSEQLVLAQKGEFIVNKDAAKKNEADLEAINSGRKPLGDAILGGGTGPAPMLAAAIMRGLTKRVNEKLSQAVANKQMIMAGAQGYSSGVGNYSLPGVKPWVLEAAGYLGSKFGIASIGGVGERSGPSDHPSGHALDFMTNDVDKGWALANEALRLQNVLDATYMIWQGKIHSFDDRGWQPYSHYSGATDPTSMHMDHVHISFARTGTVGDLPGSIPGGGGTMVDGFVMGSGGGGHPTGGVGSQGSNLHGSPPAYDISLPVGNKIYAVRTGRITSSYDIPGHEPRAAHGGLGYRSYGRVITMAHDAGGSSLYAHLSQRFVQAGQRVNAGSVIGLSGNTGYSTAPHLHFGATPAPSLYLKKGAANVNFDNTPAILHKNEAVLTEDLNRKFHEGVNNFADGPSAQYNVTVNAYGADLDENKVADLAVRKMKAAEARKPQTRTARR